MHGLWTVLRLELRLLLRGRGIWIAGLMSLFFGVYEASMLREAAYDAWEQLTVATFFVTLTLTLTTGDQVIRDRDRRVDDVLLSTPMASQSYVWGKYLAALVVLLGLSAWMLPAAIVMDHFDTWRNPPLVLGHSVYPSLGPWPYISAWLWLAVVPVIFGTALALAGVTLTRGGRVVSSIFIVLFWFVPGLFASSFSGGLVTLLDVAGWSLYGSAFSATSNILPHALQEIAYSGATPGPDLAAQMVAVITAHMPPDLPTIFIWNRISFAALAVVLVLLTALRVRAKRRGAS